MSLFDSRRTALGSLLGFMSLQLILCDSSRAGERMLAAPRVTIYPGDRIDDNLIEERRFTSEEAPEGMALESRKALIGKVARRTLLPGRPIPVTAVDNAKVVFIGTSVKIIFLEGGLEITAYGMAMQAGGLGDLIRVRNQDSGLIVSGRILGDGSVQVSEG
ncbi:MAG: flagellar basal body P-ring formation chaperone FlgA [Methylocystis sp.]|jgi:flagella basal body P-ring formation protein FlgA